MKEINESIAKAQKVLIGIGENCDLSQGRDKLLYSYLEKVLEDKDYYIITINDNENITESGLDMKRVARPLCEESGWDEYNEWLTRTLNRELCIVELGVGLKEPTVIRWPFEKIAFFNNKAIMYRIHKSLYQSTEELGEKCVSIKGDPIDIIIEE